jgi:heat-inducible transcriptional repressor
MLPDKLTPIESLVPERRPLSRPVKLSARERLILRSIIHNYILSATPLGSRSLARRYKVGLSPATIRNTMADLEEMGLLSHPHTSAGRVPTDLGYRLYVDDLMKVEQLSDDVRRTIAEQLEPPPPEVSELLQEVSEILSQVTRLLAVILEPDISNVTLQKIELVRVATGRVMVVVVVSSGLVRTILMEIASEITDGEIASATQFINQRLAGLRLVEIKRTIGARLSGAPAARNAIVRLFVDFPERIFQTELGPDVHLGGAKYVLELPEYAHPQQLKGIIELVDDQDIIVHLMKDRQPGVSVTIGEENRGEVFKDLSVITSTYRMGDAHGTLGIIGPTRMNYSRLVALVDYTAKLVSEKAGEMEET